MDKKLKILFVEDVHSDAELLLYEFNRNRIKFESHIVDNQINYISSLSSFDPDLVISDYFLPDFDGLTALAIRNELAPDLPFILVTGSLEEEVAVNCMKAGADDYIIKQNPARLGQAVERALQMRDINHRRRQAEKALMDKEHHLRQITSDLFLKDIRHKNDLSSIAEVTRYLNLVKSEKEIHEYLCATISRLLGNAIVVTSRLDEHSNVLVASASAGLDEVLDRVIKMTGMNPLAFSYPVSEITGREMEIYKSGKLEIIPDGIHSFLRREMSHEDALAIENETGIIRSWMIGFTFEEKNLGGVYILSRQGDTVEASRNVIEVIVTQASAVLHRIHLHDFLKESEEKHRTLVELSPDGILICDLAGMVRYASRRVYGIFRIPDDYDIRGRSVLQWVSPEFHQNVINRIQELLSGNFRSELREYKLCRHDGSVFWAELTSSTVPASVPGSNELMVICRDITERKSAATELERAMHKAEEGDRLKTAFLQNISH
ncbi:MAG: PAS domain S-box protein, partial [Bacteroidales bacterium]|nr:PAS domain S-box protein [Bacteroidales bacterium]